MRVLWIIGALGATAFDLEDYSLMMMGSYSPTAVPSPGPTYSTSAPTPSESEDEDQEDTGDRRLLRGVA